MCLTAHAFGMLLSIVSLNNLTVETGRVTVHTPETDILWLSLGDVWCTGPARYAYEDTPRKVI